MTTMGAPVLPGASGQVLERNLNRLQYELQRTNQAESGLVTNRILAIFYSKYPTTVFVHKLYKHPWYTCRPFLHDSS